MGYKKLNRTSEHRKALIKNMLNSLIKYEQITTTLPKAKVLKPQADKIITLGKKDTLSNTKTLISKLQDIKSTNKVTEIYVHTTEIRGRENYSTKDYEPPTEDFIDMDTTKLTINECLNKIKFNLKNN